VIVLPPVVVTTIDVAVLLATVPRTEAREPAPVVGAATWIAAILYVPSDWRVSRKAIRSPILRSDRAIVWPPFVIVAPEASIVRVQPSVVWSESMLPSIFEIVTATEPGTAPLVLGAVQPGPNSGWPGIVAGWPFRAVEPPEEVPRENATAATPTKSRARIGAKMNQRGCEVVIRKNLSFRPGLAAESRVRGPADDVAASAPHIYRTAA
jgi:hypothetical protein